MTPSSPRPETVAISAPLNRAVYDALKGRAKAEQKSISDLVRPIVLAAIESGNFPAEGRVVEPNAMPMAVRVPVAVRDRLRRQADEQSVGAAELLRAALTAYVTGADDR